MALEQRVELAVERSMNALDKRLMAGKLTQAEYDAEARRIDAWAKQAMQEKRA